MPKLTIGMLVYNDADFIEEALNSLLNQTYRDFILIISDDVSTDGSQQICERYAATDPRIKYIRQSKNSGISKNMKFLLSEAETEFFMWAADDDFWDNSYIEKLISVLEQNPAAASAFCSFQTVDENSKPLSPPLTFDYSGDTASDRIKKLIVSPNDSFGYGIFRREKIKDVEFPIWWWPNEKTAYNNIYPSLCYYLIRGEYYNYTGKPLFFNRMKPVSKVNHFTAYEKDSLKDLLAYILRKFNLITFSATLIRKSAGFWFMLKIYPLLFTKWFIKPSFLMVKHYFAQKLKKQK